MAVCMNKCAVPSWGGYGTLRGVSISGGCVRIKGWVCTYKSPYSFNNITKYSDIVDMTQSSIHWLILCLYKPTKRCAQWVVSRRHHTFKYIDIIKSGQIREQEL